MDNIPSELIAGSNLIVGSGNSYSIGTVSISGNVVTGSGTTFTAQMVGGYLILNTWPRFLIVDFVNTGQLTLSSAPAAPISGASYTIWYGGGAHDANNVISSTLYATSTTNQLILGSATQRIILSAAAPATNITLSLPTGVSDTLVSLTAGQTLTNKTLTNPTIAQITSGSATLTLPTSIPTQPSPLVSDVAGNLSFGYGTNIAKVVCTRTDILALTSGKNFFTTLGTSKIPMPLALFSRFIKGAGTQYSGSGLVYLTTVAGGGMNLMPINVTLTSANDHFGTASTSLNNQLAFYSQIYGGGLRLLSQGPGYTDAAGTATGVLTVYVVYVIIDGLTT